MLNKIIQIEHQNQRVLTTQQLAESFGTEPKRIRDNFGYNEERFVEGVHYFKLEGDDLRNFKETSFSGVVGNRVNSMYLWTKRGAARHAKMLNTDEAWMVYEELEESYFNKQSNNSLDTAQLSPELQMFGQMFKALANMEIRNKQLEARTENVERSLTLVKTTIAHRDENWRKWVDDEIKKIGYGKGNRSSDYSDARKESYQILCDRAHCDLDERLDNLKKRKRNAGATATEIKKTNFMDVIEADFKLKEIYTSIIKEMIIKYAA